MSTADLIAQIRTQAEADHPDLEILAIEETPELLCDLLGAMRGSSETSSRGRPLPGLASRLSYWSRNQTGD